MNKPGEVARAALWRAGVKTWRVAKKLDVLTRAEPAVWRMARAIAGTPNELEATVKLPHSISLVSPGNYRDLRTLMAGMYEPGVTGLFEETVRTGMHVVDVGAFIGYFCLLASRLVGAAGRVYAFEPNPIAFGFLTRNLLNNGCDNVDAIEKAVDQASGVSVLDCDPAGPESFISTTGSTETTVSVHTTSLDDFGHQMRWPPIDLVKMDIEGNEERALRGMAELSKRNPKLRLIMEFNPTAMHRAQVGREALSASLNELGFQHGFVIERGMAPVKGDLVPRTNAVCNLLFTKA